MEYRLKNEKFCRNLFLDYKEQGFSDEKIIESIKISKTQFMKLKRKYKLHSCFRNIDTCSGEFESKTPYMYSSWNCIEQNDRFETETDGINLKPVIDGMNFPENPAYIESNPLVLQESNDVIGIRTSDYKYFRDKNDPKKRIHLFDLKKDSFEENNLSLNQNLVNKYEKILKSIIENFSDKIKENNPESDEIEKELRKLGYV